MTRDACRELAEAFRKCGVENIRVMAWGGVMPLFVQLYRLGAHSVKHCALNIHTLFELADLSPALRESWAQERAARLPTQRLWTRDECERIAEGGIVRGEFV